MTSTAPTPEPWFFSAPVSPFIPGTYLQYAWDSTSLGWLKACGRKYEYSMIRGLRSRGTTSAHLTFGIFYHSGLELYDRLRAEGFDHDTAEREVVLQALRDTWEEAPSCATCKGAGFSSADTGYDAVCSNCGGQGATEPGKPWQSDHNTKTRENLVRSLVWYLEEFGANDPLKTLVLSNGKPAVELSFKFDSQIYIDDVGRKDFLAAQQEAGRSFPEAQAAWHTIPSKSYILCGHLDRIAYFGEDLYIADRKTSGSALGAYFFDGFNPSTQMTLYTLAGSLVYNLPIKGIIIDGAQIAVGFTRFGRGFSPRTQAELDEYYHDLAEWFFRAERYAAQRYWPKNEESCGNYGGCPFRKVCSRDPRVREDFIRSDFEVKPWNPLVER